MSTLAPGTAPPRAPALPTLEANPAELRLLFRYLTAMLLIATALAACVWTRMAVRSTAIELDAARSALSRAEVEHERLQVERALLRNPGRLGDAAASLSLVAPAAVVNITAAEVASAGGPAKLAQADLSAARNPSTPSLAQP